MKKIYGIFSALAISTAIALTSGGCGIFGSSDDDSKDKKESAEKDAKKPELKNLNSADAKNSELKPIAEKYIDSIITGMKTRDYKLFSEHLTDEMKSNITKEKFKAMIEAFEKDKGAYEGRTYLSEMDKGYFKIFLWKGKYMKSADKKKDTLENDTLIRLILGQVDDKYLIFGFSFQ
ncbi:MAG: hypothetical protein A2017_19120 [Lentisphaerae bacterium GWF2_44_16]|nr:MAG: hypothetical protein A2017_19120 [Lentisphaerae bacterium GWF2_44_16]